MALKLLQLIVLLMNQCLCRKKIVMAPLEECDRIRKPMHLLSEEELMLYVDGLQQIRKNGKYQIMVDAHSKETEIHRGTSFFFYHTFFVWEVETFGTSSVYISQSLFSYNNPILTHHPQNTHRQIRALGSKWNCFAIPYYDWTIDAGRERNPLILNTVFGGDGEPGNNHCVTDPHHVTLHQNPFNSFTASSTTK